MFAADYAGQSFGWAGCPEHASLAADHEPPSDDSTPDPQPYEWEGERLGGDDG